MPSHLGSSPSSISLMFSSCKALSLSNSFQLHCRLVFLHNLIVSLVYWNSLATFSRLNLPFISVNAEISILIVVFSLLHFDN